VLEGGGVDFLWSGKSNIRGGACWWLVLIFEKKGSSAIYVKGGLPGSSSFWEQNAGKVQKGNGGKVENKATGMLVGRVSPVANEGRGMPISWLVQEVSSKGFPWGCCCKGNAAQIPSGSGGRYAQYSSHNRGWSGSKERGPWMVICSQGSLRSSSALFVILARIPKQWGKEA